MELLGLTLPQLQQICNEMQLPAYNAKQIADWLYKQRVCSIDDMTNLSLRTRAMLNERYTVGRHEPMDVQQSADGTKKYLFAVGEHYVETVYIPEGDRATLCISSQAGCRMGCRFCATGLGGYRGSISAAQIVNQILSVPEASELTNIVYMGMGEPMDNYEAVLQSTEVLTAEWGMAWSPRRITVSSVGIIATLKRFIEESQCHLAISLHNPFAEQRQEIMPVQQRYPIAAVINLLRQYNWHGQRRLSFEYTMFKGVNDSLLHASELVRMLRGIPCRVNLIPFHPNPKAERFQPSSEATIARFRDYLSAHGLTATVRTSRGQDIEAACGLLATNQVISYKF